MTKEELKRANDINSKIELLKERKIFLTKTKICSFTISGKNQDIVKFSYKDVPDETRHHLSSVIDILVENYDENIASLEKELESI